LNATQTAAARYLALVHEGRNDWWRYTLSVIVIALFLEVFAVFPFQWIAHLGESSRISLFVGLNAASLCGFAGLAIAIIAIHRRRLKGLITPYPAFDWHRAAQGFAVWFAFAAVTSGLEAMLYPGRYLYTLNPESFFVFALAALFLTPLQTTAEELLFRGYVMQGLSLVLRRPAVIAIVSGLVFMLPHLANPEVAADALLVPASYFVMGVLLAAVTLKDGRLEAAIGIHAANNLFTGLIANYEASALTTDAIFTSQLDPIYGFPALLGASVATYVVLFGVRGSCRGWIETTDEAARAAR
jgi:membrane protease YdiL (CAAX protease family)